MRHFISRPVQSLLMVCLALVVAAGSGGSSQAQPRPTFELPSGLLVPLGVPMETNATAEAANRLANEEKGTAAFRLRIALPGSLGEALTAKVQSLRVLPPERLLGEAGVGGAVALPGGPGWPVAETFVTLRRLDLEAGRLGAGFNLYESAETVLLIADPRASRSYRRQEASTEADEESQCRRCAWPSYLPDPASGAPELAQVREILAGGPFLRAFLAVDATSSAAIRTATEGAIGLFRGQGGNYPLPIGWARVAAAAAPVPSPFQSSLAEPAQNKAIWNAGELGIAVSLAGGDLLLSATDHLAEGRALPFAFSRSYRSQSLGYGPLGSAGWSGNLFARLRENAITGEVEYHDGSGNVWRFFPPASDAGPGYEPDPAGSYQVAKGVYLRLQKLAGGGWRLIGRHHDTAEFDAAGRLRRISDRHRRGKQPEEQGNTIELRYDGLGQMVAAEDDLGRKYRFEYFEDPRPESQGGDGPRYGLLRRLVDFAGREVAYEFDAQRRLVAVKLPEVQNPVDVYRAEYSFIGDQRPALRYRYGAEPTVDPSPAAVRAVLHGDFAQLRLSEILLPDFAENSGEVPRATFGYARATGRVEKIFFPPSSSSAPSRVTWQISAPGFEEQAGPADRVTIRAPWGHEARYQLEQGRIGKVEQSLPVVRTSGEILDEPVSTTFAYTGDGRLATVASPDGGLLTHCFADSGREAGNVCAAAPGSSPPPADPLPGQPTAPLPVDRLALANVLRVVRQATTPEGRGTAEDSLLEISADYEGDNLVASIADGLSRAIEMPVPHPNSASRVAFQAEGIGGNFEHDAFGRVKQSRSGSSAPYEVTVVFNADARGQPEAGLPERVEQGAGRLWQAYEYDLQANVKRFKTSQGAEALADYDSWDRRVREKTGLADGRLQPIGNPQCSIAAAGSLTERAFDAAGHLSRERRLQDFVSADGELQCRWVESHYSYNPREQLVQVDQTHLSNPLVPGEVEPAARAVMRLEYDEFGRLQRHLALNSIDAAVETVFTYDPAGRAQGVQRGDGAAQIRAYDRKNRVVKTTDGDQAVWLGRYDVWDRLYWSRSPSGAFTRNIFDLAGHLTETAVFDRDPLGPQASEARLLASTRSHFTSFGEPDQVVEILAGEAGGERQILVTRREFDDAGRVKALWSGPALPTAEEIDPEKKRRESETIYETGTGRVLEAWRGGYYGQPPLQKRKFVYETDNASPWPDRMAFFESVPGRPELVETASSAFKRDALGRVIEERRNDGSRVTTSYDRSSGNVLRVRSGADAVTSMAYDGAGRLIRTVRPNHRGETLSAYDLDGRLRQQRVITSAGEWVTAHQYDRSGRPIRTNYHDGSFAELTYNPDHTVATRRTRDGVLVSFTYDAANRPVAQVPTREGTAANQLALDAGSFASYDQLSRPTLFSRGSAGTAAEDPAFSVSYPGYDLGSRPGSELVGTRLPMSWQYDVYSRRQKLFLPVGPGRDAGGPFEGFSREFDTLDRVAEVSAVGAFSASTPGATWSWGGGRLYGMTTKSGLGTSLHLGYLGGEGPQLPVEASADSKWKLGTLTWGAGAVDPTELPATVWGQFGFGYRGKEGDPRDGAKIGRRAMEGAGLDLFSSLGWSWQFDAAARLTAAWPGRGDLEGRQPPEAGGFRYRYGQGDELESLIDEVAGTAVQTETGPYGRILGLGGVAFRYDPSGRRTEDDRFAYDWSWRSELMQVTVKDEWPNGEATPFAGHQVRFAYDATGRLHQRSHYGGLPAGGGESGRPLIEKRVYVWEGQSLVAEAGYGDEAEQQPRWRKTYVPGAGGLDDAVQVLVENQAFPAQGVKLYTYLRDELGTVIGLVAEAESQDPSQPAIPARYRYTPYGEAQILAAAGPAPAAFESYRTAGDTLGGRFPGGQTSLFQGLWTDPVTGIGYARARWYDARTASWLSEDPLLDVDSPNLYAFVGWSPAMATDPLGQCRMTDWQCWKWAAQEFGSNVASDPDVSGTLKVVGGVGEMAAGVAGLATPEPTLVTKVAGWAALAHGTDVTASGLKELVSGQQQGTTTQQLATSAASTLGASDETAQTIGTSVDLAIGVASTAQSMRAASGLAARAPRTSVAEPHSPPGKGGAGDGVNNPHEHGHGFSARNVNPEGGDMNCGACAVALDETLAGRPAVAGRTGTTYTESIEAYYGESFSGGHQIEEIVQYMKNQGPGSRGIVYGSRGEDLGHFFNVVNQKGTIRFIDGQSGAEALTTGFSEFWLLPTN